MMGQNVADNWFASVWKSSRRSKSWEPERQVLGIMAFEVSRLMSKLVNIWQSLADKQIVRLREEIANSIGIQKLISENEDDLMDLAFAEIIENLKTVVNSVVMLGEKCTDPTFHNLDRFFSEEDEIDPSWYGWRFGSKKMEKRVKEMERFVVATEQLYQELEVLAELEQSLRRMRAGIDVKVLEFQQKVMRQHQEVKNLQEMSPWVRTYDYIIRLLLRFIFTIIERIKCVYGPKQVGNIADIDVRGQRNNNSCLTRSNSLKQTLVCPSETNIFSFALPLGRSFSGLGLGSPKMKLKNMKSYSRSRSSVFSGKQYLAIERIFGPAGFTGCMNGESESPVIESYNLPSSSGTSFRTNNTSRKNAMKVRDILYSNKIPTDVSFFNARSRLLDPPKSTLGYAALALRYANVIILIEKLAASPNLISLDAKDDLYNMLPATIRSCLRAKLKTSSRISGLSVYCDALAVEWRLAVVRILEWLSPLAHNTVRWHSERNFERQRLSFGSNVRLVQTLYFASQVESEAAIVELLVGLNYLFRFGREINQRT